MGRNRPNAKPRPRFGYSGLMDSQPFILIHEEHRDFRVYQPGADIWLSNLPFTDEHLTALAEAGAKTVLNLCEDSEYHSWKRPTQRQLIDASYRNLQLKEVRLPMPDKGAHAFELLDQAVELYLSARQGGRTPFVVHCRGGRERSATVVAALLVYSEGIPVKDALDRLATLWFLADPLPHQRQALARWADARGLPSRD